MGEMRMIKAERCQGRTSKHPHVEKCVLGRKKKEGEDVKVQIKNRKKVAVSNQKKRSEKKKIRVVGLRENVSRGRKVTVLIGDAECVRKDKRTVERNKLRSHRLKGAANNSIARPRGEDLGSTKVGNAYKLPECTS